MDNHTGTGILKADRLGIHVYLTLDALFYTTL